jgi:hypothetical protein
MMIQLLPNNVIEISYKDDMKVDCIKHIPNSKMSVITKFIKTARSVETDDESNTIIIRYKNDKSPVIKYFNELYNQHGIEEKVEMVKPVKKDSSTSYVSDIIGNCKLIRFPSTNTIKICGRKGRGDNKNRPNSVMISNLDRERFFKDVRNSDTYRDQDSAGEKREYKLCRELDEAVYDWWDRYIDKLYFSGFPTKTPKS